MAKVRADKEREVNAGHDGTWVAHPGLVALAKEIFDKKMPGPNQIAQTRVSVPQVTASDLLRVPEGPITEKGIRQNINVGVLYLEAWLGGLGCVPLYNLMEDAATAEISRTQLWQWIHHGGITRERYEQIRDEELKSIGERPHIKRAADMFNQLSLDDELADFLTIPAYEELVKVEGPRS
jgi:malate synthase